MRTGITVDVTANDPQRLAAIVADRNSPQKHVWRANIVLLTALMFAISSNRRDNSLLVEQVVQRVRH
jgi:hypothetical protein